MRDVTNFNSQELVDVLKELVGKVVYIKYYFSPSDEQPHYSYYVVSEVEENGIYSRLHALAPAGNNFSREIIPLVNIEFVAKDHLIHRESEPFFYYGFDQDMISKSVNKR